MAKKTSIGLETIKRHLEEASNQTRVALANYCLFKQAASDRALLKRLGTSHATVAFVEWRNTLHKECVLALMRIWHESGKDHLSIERIVKFTSASGVLGEIKQRRMETRKGTGTRLYLGEEDEETRRQILAAVDRMDERGALAAANAVDDDIKECKRLVNEANEGPVSVSRTVLRALRNQRLAHVEMEHPPARSPAVRNAQMGDEKRLLEITVKLIEKLNLLVNDLSMDTDDFARIRRRASAALWNPVRREHAEEWKEIDACVARIYS